MPETKPKHIADRENIEHLNRPLSLVPFCELLHDREQAKNRDVYGVIVNCYGVSTVVCKHHFDQYREQYSDSYILND